MRFLLGILFVASLSVGLASAQYHEQKTGLQPSLQGNLAGPAPTAPFTTYLFSGDGLQCQVVETTNHPTQDASGFWMSGCHHVSLSDYTVIVCKKEEQHPEIYLVRSVAKSVAVYFQTWNPVVRTFYFIISPNGESEAFDTPLSAGKDATGMWIIPRTLDGSPAPRRHFPSTYTIFTCSRSTPPLGHK